MSRSAVNPTESTTMVTARPYEGLGTAVPNVLVENTVPRISPTKR